MLETEGQVASVFLNGEWGGGNPEQVALLASPQRHVLACCPYCVCSVHVACY